MPTTGDSAREGKVLARSSTRSPILSLANIFAAWTSELVRKALITRSISSALLETLSLFSIFIRSALDTPSATSYWQGRSNSLHRVHSGLVPSHYKRFSCYSRAITKLLFEPTLALPLRHWRQATAIACRLFRGSGAERFCPGSPEAGAIGCHRSVGSMRFLQGRGLNVNGRVEPLNPRRALVARALMTCELFRANCTVT